MKALIIFLTFVICCGFSCMHDEDCVPVRLGEESVLSFGNTYCLNDPSLQLSISDIQDSRCPEGVVCVWQGEVMVRLLFKSGSIEEDVILRSALQPADTVGNYVFILLDALPYPKYKHPVEITDYRITVKIDKL